MKNDVMWWEKQFWEATGLVTTTEHCILTNHGIAIDFGHWFERELGLFQKTFGNKGVDSEEGGGGDTALERGDEGDEENEEEREQEEASIRLTEATTKGRTQLRPYNFAKFASLQVCKVLKFPSSQNGWRREKMLIEGTIISSSACKEFIIDLQNLNLEKAFWLLSAMLLTRLDLDWGLSVDSKITVLQQMLAKNAVYHSQVKPKDKPQILAHTGIWLIEPERFRRHDPNCKGYTKEAFETSPIDADNSKIQHGWGACVFGILDDIIAVTLGQSAT
ncbi:hypothetical protein BY996DRAFT_6486535 [Phakopsora pachyrhizi]|nr:hypothetical protein BY996DRAFT_6486535 [Phakopsora pachyrhizi]